MIGFIKKAGWTLLDLAIFCIIFALIAIPLTYLAHLLAPIDYDTIPQYELLYNPFLLLVEYSPLLIASLISGLVTHYYIFKRPWSGFGLKNERVLKEYAIGWVMALVLLIVGFLILVMVGFLEIQSVDVEIKLVLGFLLFFIVQSLFEEVAFRSYLIPALSTRFGIWPALIVSSLLFMLVHIANSNISELGMINIFLAGILLGLLFIKYNTVWVAAGLHCGWNYIQSTILGFEVSGEETYNMLQTEELGRDWITGGAFGFEGSVLATIMLFLVSAYFVIRDDEVKGKLNTNSEQIETV